MFALTFMVSLAALAAIAVVLMAYADDNSLSLIIGIIASAMVLFASGCGVFMSYEWFAAEHKARILNSEYGTNYSQQEIFFASSVIDTIKHLDRKRVELNGDLLRDESDK